MNQYEAKIMCSMVTWAITTLEPKILIVGSQISDLKELLYKEFENIKIENIRNTIVSSIGCSFDIIVCEKREITLLDLNILLDRLASGGTLLIKTGGYNCEVKIELNKKKLCVFEFCDSKVMSECSVLIIYKPFSGEKILANHSFLQAASYDNYVSNYEEDIEFIGKWLGNAKSILEIGIGTGRLALLYCNERDNYYGIDSSASMIHILQNKIKNRNIELSVFQQNMQTINLEKKFDAIILPFRVLPYLSSENEILDTLIKLEQLLDPNGRILLNMIDFDEEYIREWDNKEYYEEFRSPFNTKWIKKDIMSFDKEKKILIREIQIICEGNILCQTQDNLKWLSSKKLEILCAKAGLTVENIWPAYSFREYNGEWEYLICARKKL